MGDPLLTKEALIPYVKLFEDNSDIGNEYFCRSLWLYCKTKPKRFVKAEQIVLTLLDSLTNARQSVIAFLSLKKKGARMAKVVGHDIFNLITQELWRQRFYWCQKK